MNAHSLDNLCLFISPIRKLGEGSRHKGSPLKPRFHGEEAIGFQSGGLGIRRRAIERWLGNLDTLPFSVSSSITSEIS